MAAVAARKAKGARAAKSAAASTPPYADRGVGPPQNARQIPAKAGPRVLQRRGAGPRRVVAFPRPMAGAVDSKAEEARLRWRCPAQGSSCSALPTRSESTRRSRPRVRRRSRRRAARCAAHRAPPRAAPSSTSESARRGSRRPRTSRRTTARCGRFVRRRRTGGSSPFDGGDRGPPFGCEACSRGRRRSRYSRAADLESA